MFNYVLLTFNYIFTVAIILSVINISVGCYSGIKIYLWVSTAKALHIIDN